MRVLATRDRARRGGSGDALARAPSGLAERGADRRADNTGEPRVTGTPRVGQVQRTTRGTWTGTQPIDYVVPLVPLPRSRRAGRVGLPADHERSGRDVRRPRQADAGFRLRSRSSRRTTDGSDTATSNPTEVIHVGAARRTRPSRRSRARRSSGTRLTANRGSVGRRRTDHVLVPLAPLQHGRRQLQRDRGRDRQRVRRRDERRRPDAPRSRHGAKRRPARVRRLEPDRRRAQRDSAAADRQLGPGRRPAGSRRPPGRLAGPVLARTR